MGNGAEGAATSYGGARPVNQVLIDRQGSLAPTNGLLDLAIHGTGFFVTHPHRPGSGEFPLTLPGQFRVNKVAFGAGEGAYLNESAAIYSHGWEPPRDSA